MGSDNMEDLLTDHAPASNPVMEWKAPETKGNPRETARAWVASHFPPDRKRGFELASLGDPVPIPETGWMEYFDDGGGWGVESVCVLWLKEDGAEEWAQVDSDNFVLTEIPAASAARQIANVHEIGLVRTVPNNPRSVRIDSDQGSGDDVTSYSVRAMSISPQRSASVFPLTQADLWKIGKTGNVYDRDLAATVAVHFASKPEKAGEVRPLRTMASEWLNPANVRQVPPALSRAAIKSIGRNKWKEHLPLLEKLETSLGAPGKDEVALAELDRLIRAAHEGKSPPTDREMHLAQRRMNEMKSERIALVEKLTGSPGYELRGHLAEALAAF